MQDEVIFRYKNGRIIPIKVNKTETTNEHMNNKIRNNNAEKKEYTKKDIKPIRHKGYYNTSNDANGNPIDAYELNGIYLIKDYYWSGGGYSWQIRTDGSKYPYKNYSPGYWDKKAKGEVIRPNNYQDGIKKLLELANKK